MQRRRTFLKTVAGAAFASAGRAQTAPPSRPPNILLVLANGLPAWAAGCYGNEQILTPNLDRFAAQGVRFANSFACTPANSPSRATLFTGRTPMQHGIQDALGDPSAEQPAQGQSAPPANFEHEAFLSDILASRGYICGYFGEWRLGNERQPQHGFQRWFVLDGGSERNQDPVVYSNASGQVLRVEEKGYVTALVHERAVAFIEAQRQGAPPWFCVVAHRNPSGPLEGHPQKYYDLYRDSDFIESQKEAAGAAANLRKTAASISALDDYLGALVDYLDAKKLSYHTLVVFTSDRGQSWGRHGAWDGGASGPANLYEEVIQVPLIARWLGRIPPGRVRQELVSTYDFFPSILDLLELPLPKGRNLCGRSYWPLATTRALGRWDNRVFGLLRNTAMNREERFKLVVRNLEGNRWRGPNELWDLETDPSEQNNRIEDRALNHQRQTMIRDLNGWIKKFSR
jgi:choline-sulfatase